METNKSAILISDEHCREVIEKITSILEKAGDEIAAVMNGESEETREIVENALVENALMNTIE